MRVNIVIGASSSAGATKVLVRGVGPRVRGRPGATRVPLWAHPLIVEVGTKISRNHSVGTDAPQRLAALADRRGAGGGGWRNLWLALASGGLSPGVRLSML